MSQSRDGRDSRNDQKATVLLVDDEPNIRKTLTRIMSAEYYVLAASSAEEALDIAADAEIDLALLDINLPQMDGLQLLETLNRKHPYLAIIMLTGHGTVDTAVHAMRHGAGNFLQKPALPQEILSSIEEALAQAEHKREREASLVKAQQLLKASLQQLGQAAPEQADLFDEEQEPGEQELDPDRFLQKGPVVLDTYRRAATLDGEVLDLTPGEYDLLLCLVQHAPQVLDPQELVRQTRGFECTLHEARDLIRWQVYLLRQKVEADPSSPKYVLNVRGRGYMWAVV